MSPWSARRKLIYGGIFFLFVAGIIGSLFYFVFYEKPTCFDGKKNGLETGIDCGGGCSKVCDAELVDPVVSWARTFEVAPGSYSAAAYIQNPNLKASARKVPYVFRLFDEENILVYERKGILDIPQQSFFAIFESNINTGNRRPKYTFFEFTEKPDWKVATSLDRPEEYLRVKTQNFTGTGTSSRLDVVIENTSITVIREVELIAILYDLSGNAVAASKTFLDSVPADGEVSAVFTWPRALSDIGRSEIIPEVK